ncbi:MAG: ATP-binding protein [Parvibaculum sp.]
MTRRHRRSREGNDVSSTSAPRGGRRRERRFERRLRKRARYFTPPGMAGRIILFVIAIIMLVQFFGWLFSNDGWDLDDPQKIAAAQVVSATKLLDATDVDDRGALVRALNGIALQVELDDEPFIDRNGDWQYGDVEEEARNALAELGDRQLEIALQGGWDRDSALRLSVQLKDGNWVVYSFPFRAFELFSEEGSGFGSIIFWVFVIGAVFWFSNRLARPLRVFAEAAERIGRDVNTEPLPVAGSREIKRATRAFNNMQKRVQRMVDDRALMLAAIAHDLRTVLTRLRLRAEFIDDDEQQAKAAGDIEEMQAMLDAGLAFARGETEVEARRVVDFANLVRGLTEDFARTDGPAHYQGAEKLNYRCGPNEMRRAVSNLIRNAIAYGKKAEVSLEATPNGIALTIADEGPGIASELQEKVFQPFFRVEASRNRETGGTGLGLAIARTIARRHGGDITLSNRPGGGLIVTLSLPHAQAQ